MSNFIKDWTYTELERISRSFRRHSIFITSLKFIFPITALALAGILFIMPLTSEKKTEIKIEVQQQVPNERPAMLKPRYSGLDSKNQPYTIAAAKAYQQTDKIVDLEDVAGDITLTNGNWLSLVAPIGTYDSEKQELQLPENFDIFITEPNTKTYQASGMGLSVQATQGIAKSKGRFSATSDDFSLVSQNGFTFYRNESRILFHGRVKLVIYKK